MKSNIVPILRFKNELGKEYVEWKQGKLREISEEVIEESKKIKRILNISSINNGFVEKLLESEEESNKYILLHKDEFSYNRRNSKTFKYGCIYKLNISEALVPKTYISFKIKNQNVNFYEQLFLHKYLDKQISKLVYSTDGMDGILNISSKKFFDLCIPIPSIEEQNRICEFFSKLDLLINKQNKKLEYLNKLKKVLLEKIFRLKLRFNLNGDLCKQWEIKKLGDLGKFYRGHLYTSKDMSSEGLLVLRSSNIVGNKINYDSLQFVNNKCKEEIELKNGDIIICMSSGSKELVGKNAQYIEGKYKHVTVGIFCSIFRTNNILIKYLLQTQKYYDYLSTMLSGKNINNIKKSDLNKLSFRIPKSYEEQKKIGDFLYNLDEIINKESMKLERLYVLKKGLIRKMFI